VRSLKLVGFLASSLLVGCESDRSTTQGLLLDVLVSAEPGIPVVGARVRLDGQTIGMTDADGQVRANVWVEPGQLVNVSHTCPSNFVEASGSRALRIRRYAEGDRDARVRVRLRCRPETRLAVFVVRARGPGPVDVSIDGKWAATTDAKGVAHVSRRGAPGAEFLLELAPRNPRLRPTKTARLFVLPDSDEIFVFDQAYRARPAGKHSPSGRLRIRRIE
jgi:hypothetical protein